MQAIAAAQSIAARLSAQQPGAAPTASAPGSFGNQPYSYASQIPQASALPGPPPGPPSASISQQSDALAAAQAVAARLSAQAGSSAPQSHSFAAVASTPTPQQQHESKQEQAIRAAEAIAARFSAQVNAPTAATPYGSLYGNSTAAAPNGDSSTYSTSGVQTAATPAPAHDPVAAARAVAARLAGQMGQSGASYSKSAASAAPGQSGPSAAQDPIAAAQAVAARLAARHGDTSLGGPPSNPYGGSSTGVEGLCMPRACACFAVPV